MKFNLYDNDKIIIDRGFISTLSYEQTKKIINPSYDNGKALLWFDKIKDIYLNHNIQSIYLIKSNKKESDYFLPYNDETDPYGSIENQKLLEVITLYNLKKYVPNLIIKEYDFSKFEEVINEIIN